VKVSVSVCMRLVGGWQIWATLLVVMFIPLSLATFVVVVVKLGLRRRQRDHDAAVALRVRESLLGRSDRLVVEL